MWNVNFDRLLALSCAALSGVALLLYFEDELRSARERGYTNGFADGKAIGEYDAKNPSPRIVAAAVAPKGKRR